MLRRRPELNGSLSLSSGRWSLLAIGFALLASGCISAPNRQLQGSLLRSQQLYAQNQALSQQRDQYAAELSMERSSAMAMKQQLDVANQRLNNMLSSNGQLEQRMQSMLASQSSPLSGNAIRSLQELRERFPHFEFDPATGVLKFPTDILFDSGSDRIRPEPLRALQEFAQIMTGSDTRHLKLLVVGHTDDRPIGKPNTKAQHATNWHLSTNRADAVVLALSKAGVADARLGAAGYSMYQPRSPNTSEDARQRNRRVEIFILPPDSPLAGNWDPANMLK